MKARRASLGPSSLQFLWPSYDFRAWDQRRRQEGAGVSGAGREGPGFHGALGPSEPTGAQRVTRAARGSDVKCSVAHQRPEAHGRCSSQGGALCLRRAWASGRARPGPERECRPPEGGGGGSDAVCSGASWPRAPWGPTHCAGLARDLAAVEPPLEVGPGPTARLRETGLGAFRGWGASVTHLSAERLFSYL